MEKQITRILGLDPGLCNLGWGVVDWDGARLSFVGCGTIKTDADEAMGQRLATLFAGLEEVVQRWVPMEAAVEETFVNGNARSALKLGQARGIALLVPARLGLDVAEYAPNTVKKTVTGSGHADKAQIGPCSVISCRRPIPTQPTRPMRLRLRSPMRTIGALAR